jgi:hypothetical protein
MFLLLRLAAAMHLLDLGLSCTFLSLGWMQEANPLAAIIYEQTGVAGLIGFKMTLLIAAVAAISLAIERRSVLAAPATAITLATGLLAVTMLVLVMNTWRSVDPADQSNAWSASANLPSSVASRR